MVPSIRDEDRKRGIQEQAMTAQEIVAACNTEYRRRLQGMADELEINASMIDNALKGLIPRSSPFFSLKSSLTDLYLKRLIQLPFPLPSQFGLPLLIPKM